MPSPPKPLKLREDFRIESFHQEIQAGPCFICEMVAGHMEHVRHDMIYEDDFALVFLDKYPTLYGHTIVAPKAHREQVTGDFTPEEYLALQAIVYRVGQAIRKVVRAERLYVCSFGSQQAVRHVHWHLAPLPPGVPFVDQQCAALDKKRGVMDISPQERARLSKQIRDAMND